MAILVMRIWEQECVAGVRIRLMSRYGVGPEAAAEVAVGSIEEACDLVARWMRRFLDERVGQSAPPENSAAE